MPVGGLPKTLKIRLAAVKPEPIRSALRKAEMRSGADSQPATRLAAQGLEQIRSGRDSQGKGPQAVRHQQPATVANLEPAGCRFAATKRTRSSWQFGT